MIGEEKRQVAEVPSGETAIVYKYEVPWNLVGFLYALDTSYDPLLDWEWYIDGEIIGYPEKGIRESFNPPFVIESGILLKATNNTDDDMTVYAECEAELYQNKKNKNISLKPVGNQEEAYDVQMVSATLTEIKEELESQTPKGEMFDKKVEVSDSVKMYKNLGWTACTILNNGPDPLYYVVNEWKRPTAPIPNNESASIDLGRRGKIDRLYLTCDSGESATAVIHILK